MKKIIEVKEEVKIGNVILEKGDKIEILKEKFIPFAKEAEKLIYEIGVDEYIGTLINSLETDPNFSKFVDKLKEAYDILQQEKMIVANRYY